MTGDLWNEQWALDIHGDTSGVLYGVGYDETGDGTRLSGTVISRPADLFWDGAPGWC